MLSDEELNKLRWRAVEEYQTDDIQIDPLAQSDVITVEDGFWVRAWVWLTKDDADEADCT